MSLFINNNEEQRFGYLPATEVTDQWTNFLWFVASLMKQFLRIKIIITFNGTKRFVFYQIVVFNIETHKRKVQTYKIGLTLKKRKSIQNKTS